MIDYDWQREILRQLAGATSGTLPPSSFGTSDEDPKLIKNIRDLVDRGLCTGGFASGTTFPGGELINPVIITTEGRDYIRNNDKVIIIRVHANALKQSLERLVIAAQGLSDQEKHDLSTLLQGMSDDDLANLLTDMQAEALEEGKIAIRLLQKMARG